MRLPTYEPASPDSYPHFLDRRVYQGSSGRVYPLPLVERIESEPAPREWRAVHLENRWLRLVVLPELGGRIHVGRDRSNGYDFFYRNSSIKPALVGLAGPWIAGGVEFNWPQHHRPATYLPTDVEMVQDGDGSITVWMSDHDPFTRMKGMHGIRLRPDSSLIELRVRLSNRTEVTQTFLWWANAAVHVDDRYQSFFPPDVTMVADHARRAVTSFPRADRPYYGIDYASRLDESDPDADRLDWYRNIPVPTSYMAVGSSQDFFGGYDHGRQAGFVHWADHLIAPGKKQWTWGASDFGQAWERQLTDGDGPYVELMAGVFTDNQPDFAFLIPGETKTFSQYWFPYQGIGVVHQATRECAAHLDVNTDETRTHARWGVAVTRTYAELDVAIMRQGEEIWRGTAHAAPNRPMQGELELEPLSDQEFLTIVVRADGSQLLAYEARPELPAASAMEPAAEPPHPQQLASVEELFLIGQHLHQYRHATRDPLDYWTEALLRDPEDSRSNTAVGALRYGQGAYDAAIQHLQTAVRRLTRLNANPRDGEAHYLLGLALSRAGRAHDAREALGKATWNAALAAPAAIELARLDAAAGVLDPERCLARVRTVPENSQARAAAAVILRRLGEDEAARSLVEEGLAIDPLDAWLVHLASGRPPQDAATALDVALEYDSLGAVDDAIDLLRAGIQAGHRAGEPDLTCLLWYHLADSYRRCGDSAQQSEALRAAWSTSATWCFPSRLADHDMLRRTIDANPTDARAHALLGHWLYSKDRREEALGAWEAAAQLDGSDPVVWRNIGLAKANISRDLDGALLAYGMARQLALEDARLLYEYDQLARTAREPASVRLTRLRHQEPVTLDRDDLALEYVRLLIAEGDTDAALAIMTSRTFQPWEGGEGAALSAWDELCLARGRSHLDRGEAGEALDVLHSALNPPTNLGEDRHPLANRAHLLQLVGDAYSARGDLVSAAVAWRSAVEASGDFEQMRPTAHSELTYYRIVAAQRLGEEGVAKALSEALLHCMASMSETTPGIDYFATSLPTMLLFPDDLKLRRDVQVMVMEAQLAHLAQDLDRTRYLIDRIAALDPGNLRAIDLDRIVRYSTLSG